MLAQQDIAVRDGGEAVDALAAWLKSNYSAARLLGVGHRVVHGGPNFAGPMILTPEILAELHELIPLAPLHQPSYAPSPLTTSLLRRGACLLQAYVSPSNRAVCRAIMNSSLVGMTHAETSLCELEMQGPFAAFAFSSTATPNQADDSQIRRRRAVTVTERRQFCNEPEVFSPFRRPHGCSDIAAVCGPSLVVSLNVAICGLGR
jgi:hypothetical protein